MMDEMVAARGLADHPRLEWVWNELGLMSAQVQLGTHPYVLAIWRGGIVGSELRLLATEYEHIAVAIARAAPRIAEGTGGRLGEDVAALAEDAEQDVHCWRRFSLAVGRGHPTGWRPAAQSLPETVACAGRLDGSAHAPSERLIGGLFIARLLQARFAGGVAEPLESRYRVAPLGLEWFTRRAAGGGRAIGTTAGQRGQPRGRRGQSIPRSQLRSGDRADATEVL